MKYLIFFFLGISLLSGAPASSQVTSQGLLTIKDGSILHYTSEDHGSLINFPVQLVSRNKEGVSFKHTVSHGDKSFSGNIFVPVAGEENGTELNKNGLNPGEERKLTSTETIFFFSKHFYKELVKNKTAKYDNTEYVVTKMPAGKDILIGKKKVDAIYMF